MLPASIDLVVCEGDVCVDNQFTARRGATFFI